MSASELPLHRARGAAPEGVSEAPQIGTAEQREAFEEFLIDGRLERDAVLRNAEELTRTIRSVDDVADSKKLVRLTVSFGDHSRSILAGMKGEREDPTEIVGQQGLFLINLEPKTMAGEVSEGMLLDIGYADGITPALAVPEQPVPDGARVG